VTPAHRPGQFVWCRFPTAEQPEAPGPKSRIGYILAVRRIGRADVAAMLYTTTARWPSDAARPLGVIPIDEPRARAIGQKPFMIDVRTAAALPITIEFFPHLERDDRGIQGVASAGLSRKIESVLEELRRRRIAIELRGPSGR
jgi:hypothetical protein